jgi:hypothetical protein
VTVIQRLYARFVRGFRGIGALKRGAVATVIAVALAVPASALASGFFKGPVGGGVNNAGVEFRVDFKNGEPQKVIEFRWFNVPVPPNCADSFEGTQFKMSVSDTRRFHGKYMVPNTNRVATVHGKFKHHNKKAVGTLKLRGSFSGGCTGANTGDLPWVAHKANG